MELVASPTAAAERFHRYMATPEPRRALRPAQEPTIVVAPPAAILPACPDTASRDALLRTLLSPPRSSEARTAVSLALEHCTAARRGAAAGPVVDAAAVVAVARDAAHAVVRQALHSLGGDGMTALNASRIVTAADRVAAATAGAASPRAACGAMDDLELVLSETLRPLRRHEFDAPRTAPRAASPSVGQHHDPSRPTPVSNESFVSMASVASKNSDSSERRAAGIPGVDFPAQTSPRAASSRGRACSFRRAPADEVSNAVAALRAQGVELPLGFAPTGTSRGREQQWSFGARTVALSASSGSVVVAVGGGYVPLAEYAAKHTAGEMRRILAASRSPDPGLRTTSSMRRTPRYPDVGSPMTAGSR